ncbi:Hypothetical protein NGAL_HAMBI490_60380 [Neorhizobium galegae bv. officinalis]|nr:Hypothetical protein NGAL_HAMBI490_60380 [Neorhizobium galegae bv. officinalis]
MNLLNPIRYALIKYLPSDNKFRIKLIETKRQSWFLESFIVDDIQKADRVWKRDGCDRRFDVVYTIPFIGERNEWKDLEPGNIAHPVAGYGVLYGTFTVSFRTKTDAMLWKLAHGGAA